MVNTYYTNVARFDFIDYPVPSINSLMISVSNSGTTLPDLGNSSNWSALLINLSTNLSA
jgi:hypothetical protein